jgi:hypothetical protein
MVKLLSKYKNWLLIGFGVFLMIAFLVPQFLQNLAHSPLFSSSGVTIKGRSITQIEMNQSLLKFETLKRFSLFRIRMVELNIGQQDHMHWKLLVEDAKAAGLVGPREDARGLRNELIRAEQFVLANEVSRGELTTDRAMEILARAETEIDAAINPMLIANQSGVDYFPSEAISELHGVSRLLGMYQQAARTSTPRLAMSAREQFNRVFIQHVGLSPSEESLTSSPDPTEQELQAHFEKFRNTDPATGEFRVGYLLDNAVKLNVLTIDPAQIAATVRIDPIEVEKRMIAAADRSPAPTRADIEAALRTEVSQRILSEATSTVKAEILRYSSRLPEGESVGSLIYRSVTPAATPIDFAAVAGAVVARIEDTQQARIPTPAVASFDSWTTLDDVLDLPQLSTAVLRRGRTSENISSVLGNLRELKPASPTVAVQLGVPMSEPLIDQEGRRHFILVTALRPRGPAASIDDVRTVAVRDFKRLRAYNELLARRTEFEALATIESFTTLPDRLAPLGFTTTLKTQVEVARNVGVRPSEPWIERDAVISAAFEAAGRLSPSAPLDETNISARTFTAGMPASQTLMIAQITNYEPVSVERFRQLATSEENRLLQAFVSDSLVKAMSLEALVERLEVEGLRPGRDDDAGSGTTPDQNRAPAPAAKS